MRDKNPVRFTAILSQRIFEPLRIGDNCLCSGNEIPQKETLAKLVSFVKRAADRKEKER